MLARDGLDVVVLEASNGYVNRVRGESLLPWGFKEAQELGIHEVLLEPRLGIAIEGLWVK